MGKIIGIDLGTTNSLAAVWEKGGVQLIANALGEYLTPSVVSIDEDGTVYTGKVAKERLITHPESTVSSFKRFMGTDRVYTLSDKTYTPQELSALVLARLKEDAEAYLGEKVEEAVISVPAYFSDRARKATKSAGELAGLVVERIINEPSAAALACQKQDDEEEATMLVFDMGGGTLDVSVVDCFENVIEILAVSGDNHLGGNDFDQVIAHAFCRENGLNWESLTAAQQGILLESAIHAKEALSQSERTTVTVTGEGIGGQMPLDRTGLIQLAAQLFNRMSVPVRRVLNDAGAGVERLSKIVLVGGSCKMPIVHKFMEHLLERTDIHTVDPDHMIALGVGIYAGIKERHEEVKDLLLTDIAPFSLSVNIHNPTDPHNDLSSVLIGRNTALPASREGVFVTVSDYQKKIIVKIGQGEELYFKNNIQLGELSAKVPARPQGQESVTIRYTYDINGILVVDMKVNSTDEHHQLVIVDQDMELTQEQIAEKARQLEKLKVHPRDLEENQLVLSRGEKLYTQCTGGMRDDIVARISYFSHLMEKQDPYRIMRWRKILMRYFDQIEEYLLSVASPLQEAESFAAWYRENGEREDENEDEDQEEIDAYDLWRNGHLTS